MCRKKRVLGLLRDRDGRLTLARVPMCAAAASVFASTPNRLKPFLSLFLAPPACLALALCSPSRCAHFFMSPALFMCSVHGSITHSLSFSVAHRAHTRQTTTPLLIIPRSIYRLLFKVVKNLPQPPLLFVYTSARSLRAIRHRGTRAHTNSEQPEQRLLC